MKPVIFFSLFVLFSAVGFGQGLSEQNYRFDFQLYYWPMDKVSNGKIDYEEMYSKPKRLKVFYLESGEVKETVLRRGGKTTWLKYQGHGPLVLYREAITEGAESKVSSPFAKVATPGLHGKYLILLIETPKGLQTFVVDVSEKNLKSDHLLAYNFTNDNIALAIGEVKAMLPAKEFRKDISLEEIKGKTVKIIAATKIKIVATTENKGKEDWVVELNEWLSRRRNPHLMVIFFRTNFNPEASLRYLIIDLDSQGVIEDDIDITETGPGFDGEFL